MTDNTVGLEAVAESTGRFANSFLKTVADDKPGNLITSPLSAQVVLAMAAYGASGTTATQMRSSLLIPSDDALAQSGYQCLIETLNAPRGVQLRLANKIYTAIQAGVKPTYKELTAKKFLSASQEVDFSDTQGTANTINAWCEDQTNKRIKDLITPDSISHDTMLVLVNAVYFKGHWEKKFDPSVTQDRPFHVNKTTTNNVPTMFVKNKLRFGQIPEMKSRFLEIPYEGGEVSMVIILPNEIDGLETVKANLDKVNLGRCLQQSFPSDVEVFLPKFKIESTLDLKVTLEKLGMTEMFDDCADFSEMADIPVKVSKVIQKAFIEVNEEGSEAAAATAVMMTLRCAFPTGPPVVFKIDRPFYYAIHHNGTNIPLFTGVVYEPTAA